MMLRSRFLLPWVLLASTAHVGAMAQVGTATQPATTGPEDAAPRNAAVGDDIVVTARRSAEDIQSTPVSVTAFSAETLRQASIQNTQDLVVKTPGIFLAGSGGRENTIYAIRGQAKALSGNSAPGVIPYFAEVPSPVAGANIPTYDLGNVQVLKGPQGTLFGRNTTGGAILYYPTAPNYEIGGYVEAAYGNYDDRRLEGAINVPIVQDRVALRVAGQYQKRDGYTRNIGVGRDLDDVNSRAFRASLLIEPVDGVRNTTIYDYSRSRVAGDATVLIDVDRSSGLLAALGVLQPIIDEFELQQKRGPRVINSDVAPFQRVSRKGLTNRTEIELADGLEFINIFGYRRVKLSYFASSDGLPTLISTGGAIPAGLPVTVVNGQQTQNIEQISDEMQLHAKALDNKLDLIVGAFYLESKPKGPSGTYVPIFTIPGVTDVPFSYNFSKEKSKAVFGNVGYALDDIVSGLRFNAGLRYTKDTISACVAGGLDGRPNVQPEDCQEGAANAVNPSVNRTSSDAITWQVGLDWQVDPDLFLYVVTRRGYRTGGINSPTLSGRLTPFQSFTPEKVTDVELGVRSEFRAGDITGRFNVSAFAGWYSGVQVPLTGLTNLNCDPTVPGGTAPGRSPDGDCDTSNDPTGGTLLVNAGKTRVSGIDFDGRIQPFEPLAITFGGTLLDTKSREFTVPADLQPYLVGTDVPFNLAAKFTFTAGLRYVAPVPESIGELVGSLDFYHTSDVPLGDISLPGYDIFNARIDLNNVGGAPIDLSVYARNLFDKEYLSTGTVTSAALGITSAIYGPPRMYGVSVRYRFGS